MDKKIIAYIMIGIIILLLILSSFGVLNFNSGRVSTGNNDYSNLPQECRPPAGQDIEAWKEHLGHHQNTLYCLEYYK